MRSARTLFLLHLTLAALAAGLVVGGAATVIAELDLSPPSVAEVSTACQDWLRAGGPAALVGLGLLALPGTVLFLGLRSLYRQIHAGRVYLARLTLGPELTVGGVRCRRVDSREPVAFCAGYLRPCIFLSSGALEELKPTELRAVLAHEAHHVGRRDPLRRLIARSLADGLFFVPLLRRISDRYASLGEIAADERAVGLAGGPGPLARALLKFSAAERLPASVVGIDPERVDHLAGDPEAGRWRLPRTLLVSSALALGALGLTVILIVGGAVTPAAEAPLLLAAGCMVAMVLAPVILAGTALLASWRALQARRA